MGIEPGRLLGLAEEMAGRARREDVGHAALAAHAALEAMANRLGGETISSFNYRARFLPKWHDLCERTIGRQLEAGPDLERLQARSGWTAGPPPLRPRPPVRSDPRKPGGPWRCPVGWARSSTGPPDGTPPAGCDGALMQGVYRLWHRRPGPHGPGTRNRGSRKAVPRGDEPSTLSEFRKCKNASRARSDSNPNHLECAPQPRLSDESDCPHPTRAVRDRPHRAPDQARGGFPRPAHWPANGHALAKTERAHPNLFGTLDGVGSPRLVLVREPD